MSFYKIYIFVYNNIFFQNFAKKGFFNLKSYFKINALISGNVVNTLTGDEENIKDLSDKQFIEYYNNRNSIGTFFYEISKDPRAYNTKKEEQRIIQEAEVAKAEALDMSNK